MSNGGGAFRDAGAALERAAMLEQENELLKDEIADLAKLRIEVEELEPLRAQLAALRDAQRSPNEDAFLRRLQEERIELSDEVKTLRARLAEQERQLEKLKREAKAQDTLGASVARFLDTLLKR